MPAACGEYPQCDAAHPPDPWRSGAVDQRTPFQTDPPLGLSGIFEAVFQPRLRLGVRVEELFGE